MEDYFKGDMVATCKGSVRLGTGCLKCPKCKEEMSNDVTVSQPSPNYTVSSTTPRMRWFIPITGTEKVLQEAIETVGVKDGIAYRKMEWVTIETVIEGKL